MLGKWCADFCIDENGKAVSVQISCLKPRVGLETVLEETPEHLPDFHIFPIHDIIFGPLSAIALRMKKFNIPAYNDVLTQFNTVKQLDRKSLFDACV